MENIDAARFQAWPTGRRIRLPLLLAIALLHLILLLAWPAKRRAVSDGTVSVTLPVWRVRERAREPQNVKSETRLRGDTRLPIAKRSPTAASALPSTVVAEQAEPDSPSVHEAPAPVAPRLDFDSMRSQAIEFDKHREITPAERLRAEQFKPHTVESGIADAAKRGTRGDCQNEYASMGLLAVVPLLVDTVTNRGCKWK